MGRYTDCSRWDDDWYLDLMPAMKCAWEYVNDTCDGVGFKTISFKKLSTLVGGEVTRADFDQCFGSKIHWVSENEFWIFGKIGDQLTKLSPRNRAHVNMALLVLRRVADLELPEAAGAIVESLKQLFQADTNPDPGRAPDEDRPEPVRSSIIRIRKRIRIKKGGVGENNSPPQPIDRDDALAVASALKRFNSDDWGKRPEEVRAWLGDELYEIAVRAGTWKMRQLKPDAFFIPNILGMLRDASFRPEVARGG